MRSNGMYKNSYYSATYAKYSKLQLNAASYDSYDGVHRRTKTTSRGIHSSGKTTSRTHRLNSKLQVTLVGKDLRDCHTLKLLAIDPRSMPLKPFWIGSNVDGYKVLLCPKNAHALVQKEDPSFSKGCGQRSFDKQRCLL